MSAEAKYKIMHHEGGNWNLFNKEDTSWVLIDSFATKESAYRAMRDIVADAE